MVGISEHVFKTTMNTILRVLMGKVNNMQEQMDNISREMDFLKEFFKMLVINNTVNNEKCF